MQPQTDKDFLDLSIEIYKLLYAKAYKTNYTSNKINDDVIKEPFMVLLLEYKFNYDIKTSETTPEEKEKSDILN